MHGRACGSRRTRGLARQPHRSVRRASPRTSRHAYARASRVEHHRGREDHADGVGNARSGDVACRAMRGLEQRTDITDIAREGNAEAADHGCPEVRSDVAEHVLSDDDVWVAGLQTCLAHTSADSGPGHPVPCQTRSLPLRGERDAFADPTACRKLCPVCPGGNPAGWLARIDGCKRRARIDLPQCAAAG